ncbi:hypothetical protein MM239_14950 [Belliella sp. DSM 111904]|uniref:Uncharacterized protein n=1 Tax=Belliella filtrata TaxID=2923435 RepID=A0ABS9V2X5_9BACT|nr:hypothetical protein [Belliella filtrata]MCH7410704.1 hypothetical protein [Belliella filtrata]
MKFIIEYGHPVEQRLLTYIQEEYSFDMEPFVKSCDFELILNKISLSVIDDTIVQITGFCGLDKSMKSNYQVPEYKKGCLRVEHNLNYGFAYGVNDDDNYEYPVCINVQSGWVCIGNPEKKGNAVEFINNCVAVIDDDKEFVSLWLKPEKLPDI